MADTQAAAAAAAVSSDAQPTSRQSQHNPSPHSYPSPPMNPTYAYPPPSSSGPVAGNEHYRASPTPLPSLNLPPIRAIDSQAPPPPSQQQPPPPQHPPSQQHQAMPPLPPSMPSMSSYYPPPQAPGMHAPGQPLGLASPPSIGMRYPLPVQGQDQRIMSGGRHKKEIKRRTKTGCLTCRKRRIKVRFN